MFFVTNATTALTIDSSQNATFAGGLVGTFADFSQGVYDDSSGIRIVNPGGGSRTTQDSSTTGAIKITLPVSWTNTMMRMTIKVYEYTTNESFTVVCGGYNYSPTSSWINHFAYIESSAKLDRNFTVRFGHDGSKCCIYIGELTSSWTYTQVFVTDVQLGYSGLTGSAWRSGWVVGFEASAFGTITKTELNPQVNNWARNGSNLSYTSGSGNVLVTTQSANDNSTKAASTAYVDTAVAGAGSGTFLPLVGGTMGSSALIGGSGTLELGGSGVTNLLLDSDGVNIMQFKKVSANLQYAQIISNDDKVRLRFRDGMDIYYDDTAIIEYMKFHALGGHTTQFKNDNFEIIGIGTNNDEMLFKAEGGGAVSLYHNNVLQLNTTSTGISTNTIDATVSAGSAGNFVVMDGTRLSYRTAAQVLSDIGGVGSSGVTSVATGGGLDGGTITTTGTIQVEYDGVATNIIQSGFDYTGDTVVPGDYMMISDPGQTTTNRRIGYVTVGDLPKAPQTTFTRTINASTYTMLCTVEGNRLASIVDLTITGTSNGVVLAASFEIIVNHYQDIHVRSMSGDYVDTAIKITSNNNEDYSIEAKTASGGNTQVEVCVFARANEIINPTTTDPGYTGAEYTHTATEGWRFGGEDGNVESSRVVIDGALAINTTSPTKPLTVNGTIRAEDNNSGDYIDITNDGSVSGHSKIETSSGNLIVDPAGVLDVQANAVVKTSNGVGDFYIGNYATAKHFRFHTNNNQTYFDMNCSTINWREGSSTRYYFYPGTANMTINGTLTQNSDSRVKENVVEIDDCIGKVQAMKGVYYNRTDFNTDVTKVGVIAQDVEAVLPELILEAPDTGLKSVAYAELTAVLINAIKEQQEIIDDLKTRVQQLEK